MKINFKYTDKELVDIGRFICGLDKTNLKTLAIATITKLSEIQENKLIILPYLKVNLVKNMSKNEVNRINENATHRLLNSVFNKKLTREDFQKIKFSYKTEENKIKLLYFDGKFIGEFMQIKEDEYFKLVFRFE